MMRRVVVRNETRGQVLADHARWADSVWSRFRGLMGASQLETGDALVLKPGGAIHMFFMRIPLDVLHVDGKNRVTHVLRGIRPWRIGPLLVGSALTVELPVGAAALTEPGDEISLIDVRVTSSVE